MSQPAHILVIDDEALNRILLETALSQAGYVVETAVDGNSACHLLQQTVFDLILLDLLLPDLHGEQLLAQIKANSVWQQIPVIIISAIEEQDSWEKYQNLGAVGFLPKPFNPEEVHRAVQAAL